MKKYIAVIPGSYVRDTQIYAGDPKEDDWEDDWRDAKRTTFYIGIFEGTEDEIRCKVAKQEEIHPEAVQLIQI